MPQQVRYKVIEEYERLISLILNDNYFCGANGIYTNSRDTAKKKIYYQPLDSKTISAYPALSISFEADVPVVDSNTSRMLTETLTVQFNHAEKLADLNEATKNSYKRLADIRHTIYLASSKFGAAEFSGIAPVEQLPNNNLWTNISEMFMTLKIANGKY